MYNGGELRLVNALLKSQEIYNINLKVTIW